MSSRLPEIRREAFGAALSEIAPVPLAADCVEILWIHYQELVRWNRRSSLIGSGTAAEVLSRHYGESLAALTLLGEEDRCLVDIGSGAGFPGFVLAAARPDLDVTLVEATQKKWSFLSLVCQKTALPCHCLNARVTSALAVELPQQIDVVTTRAVKLSRAEIAALAGRLTVNGRFLFWTGEAGVPEIGVSGLPAGRKVHLQGSRHRRIEEVTRSSFWRTREYEPPVETS